VLHLHTGPCFLLHLHTGPRIPKTEGSVRVKEFVFCCICRGPSIPRTQRFVRVKKVGKV
jgi:hypothetical protein